MKYIVMESRKETGKSTRFIVIEGAALSGRTPDERLGEIHDLTSAQHKELELCFNGLFTEHNLDRRFPGVPRWVIANSEQFKQLKEEFSRDGWSWPDREDGSGIRRQFGKINDDREFNDRIPRPREFGWDKDIFLMERIRMQARRFARQRR